MPLPSVMFSILGTSYNCKDDLSASDVVTIQPSAPFTSFYCFCFGRKIGQVFYLFIEQVRGTVADFAVFLSVSTWTFVDYMFGVDTPKLNVPSDFKPTRSDRFIMHIYIFISSKNEVAAKNI